MKCDICGLELRKSTWRERLPFVSLPNDVVRHIYIWAACPLRNRDWASSWWHLPQLEMQVCGTCYDSWMDIVKDLGTLVDEGFIGVDLAMNSLIATAYSTAWRQLVGLTENEETN